LHDVVDERGQHHELLKEGERARKSQRDAERNGKRKVEGGNA
jgi:hypothetical protein